MSGQGDLIGDHKPRRKCVNAAAKSLWYQVYLEPWFQGVGVRPEGIVLYCQTKRGAVLGGKLLDDGKWEGWPVEVLVIGKVTIGGS